MCLTLISWNPNAWQFCLFQSLLFAFVSGRIAATRSKFEIELRLNMNGKCQKFSFCELSLDIHSNNNGREINIFWTKENISFWSISSADGSTIWSVNSLSYATVFKGILHLLVTLYFQKKFHIEKVIRPLNLYVWWTTC